MAAFDEADYQRALDALESDHQRVDVAPTLAQKLGRFTVVCLILNRTIGSGIFVTPSKVIEGTGSVGISLLFWTFGGMVATCGLLVWLELGLTLPLQRIPVTGETKSVPRSGGEKNYLEFIFRQPKFLMTCIYGITFILLGNLSGNAIAFGEYVMMAANQPNPSRGSVIGLAIAVLTAVVVLHTCSRRGGIMINNLFAILKVAILLTIIILGFIKAGGHELGGDPKATENFDPEQSFKTSRRDVASYTDSFLYVMYTYSGFEQPFYVLSEVRKPRKVFPKWTLTAMAIAITLFVLTNVAYLCAVPKNAQLNSSQDMASLFFGKVFGDNVAKRVMAAIIAFSIAGNILVMTFTASRVKQEIAKEGILPASLFFATGHTTPYAWLKARMQGRKSEDSAKAVDDHLEKSPMAALGLHYVTSLFLIAITSMLEPRTAYSFLVSLYSYVIIILNGALVSGGLLLLKARSSREWSTYQNFRPWISPLHAIIYFLFCTFLLFTAFAKPTDGSPYSYAVSHIQWFIIPAIGLSTLTWGVFWYGGLHAVMLQRRRRLVVTRVPFIVEDEDDEGQWIQKSEIVDHEWHALGNSRNQSLADYELA